MEKNDNEGANHPVKIEYKNIGINLSSTEFTKLLSIAPRYLLLNRSRHGLQVRQSRITEEACSVENQFSWEQVEDWHSLQNDVHFVEVHFSKWKGHVLSSIQIKLKDEDHETYWSNELQVHAIRPRRMYFRVCKKGMKDWIYMTMAIKFWVQLPSL